MSQKYFAQITPGLEEVLKQELKTLGCRKLKLEEGGVYFEGTRKHLYRVLQWSRLANRIYWTLIDATAPNSNALFERVIRGPWAKIFSFNSKLESLPIALRVNLGQHPEFQGTGQIESLVFRAIEKTLVDHIQVKSAKWNSTDPHCQRLLIRVHQHRITIRLDASGHLLHKRGWRSVEGQAPLRPTLAAAMLDLVAWNTKEPLIDPMCGSGTIPIEAARKAAFLQPRLPQTYTCQLWENYDLQLWEQETNFYQRSKENQFTENSPSQTLYQSHIYAFDISPDAIKTTQSHLQKAEIMVQVTVNDVASLRPPLNSEPGLIIFNPPYGLRVKEGHELKKLLTIFSQDRSSWLGWRLGFIYPRQLSPPSVAGLQAKEVARFQHGGLPVWVWTYTHS